MESISNACAILNLINQKEKFYAGIDKLIKPLTEAKYLNADNVSRYRCIMRIFFEHYEKLKYWLYQEEVYEEMIQDPLFADYRPEQCQ